MQKEIAKRKLNRKKEIEKKYRYEHRMEKSCSTTQIKDN